MTILVTQPTEVSDQEVSAAATIEADVFGAGPMPDAVVKDDENDLTETEVRGIAARLNRPVLRPRVRLLLSRPHIFGTYLKQLADEHPDAGRRTTTQSADFVLGRLEDDQLLEQLAVTMPVETPTIPGSPCDVGNVPLGGLLIPPISAAINPVLIDAAADLADITAVGDGMGVFAARTALVSRWASGEFRFTDQDVNRFLYCRTRDNTDLTDSARHGVEATVLGTPGAPAGTDVNTAFPPAFQRLLTALVRFDRDQCVCGSDADPSRAQSDIAAEEVRFNLARAVTGVTEFQIRDLHAELERALFVLGNEEVVKLVAGDDPGGVWAVVSRLLDAGATNPRDLVGLFAAAQARRDIFAWLRYEPGGGDPGEEAAFQAAVEAAVRLETIESVPSRPKMAAATNGHGATVPSLAATTR